MKKLTIILITVFGLFTMLNASNYPVPSAYRAAMPQNKNRLKKMGRIWHNTFRLSKLVGKHSNAHCNSFGKLRFFRKNNYAILLPRRRKIWSKPYSNFKTCTKSNTNRRSFNPLFRRSFSFKICGKMA